LVKNIYVCRSILPTQGQIPIKIYVEIGKKPKKEKRRVSLGQKVTELIKSKPYGARHKKKSKKVCKNA
jgi:hypothetical protein